MISPLRLLGCAVALGSILVTPGSARAEELQLALDSECEDAPVLDEVEARLGRPLARTTGPLIASVALHRRGRRVRVVVGLTREGAHSERAWWAEDCEAAVRATALVLALALDAETEAWTPPSTAHRLMGAEVALVPAVSPTSSIALEPVEPPPRLASTESGDRHDTDARAVLFAGPVLDGGTLPDAQGGVRLGAGLGLGPGSAFRLELDATYLASARIASTAPGASVDVTMASGTLRVGGLFPLMGPALSSGALSVGAAAELVVGAAIGTGTGARVQGASTTVLPWIATRATLAVELVLFDPVSLRLTGSVGVPVLTPRFRIVGVPSTRPANDILVEGAALVVFRLT